MPRPSPSSSERSRRYRQALWPALHRRIAGKTSFSALATRTSTSALVVSAATTRSAASSRGHYDVLKVLRTSTAGAVRSAYRRQALVTHPDKGGSSADFQRVAEAFEVLSDPTARRSYDQRLDACGSTDGMPSARVVQEHDESPALQYAEARVHLNRFVKEVCCDLCSSVDFAQLSHDMLEIIGELCPKIWPTTSKGQTANATTFTQTKYICKLNNGGYKVEIAVAGMLAWARTNSLDEAIEMHIALTEMRSQALQRVSGGGSGDPFIGSEVLHALRTAPAMPLFFTSIKKIRGKLVRGPETWDLDTAVRFHRHLTVFSTEKASDERISAAKSLWKQEAATKAHLRREFLKKLPGDIAQELQARVAARQAEEERLVRALRLLNGMLNLDVAAAESLVHSLHRLPLDERRRRCRASIDALTVPERQLANHEVCWNTEVATLDALPALEDSPAPKRRRRNTRSQKRSHSRSRFVASPSRPRPPHRRASVWLQHLSNPSWYGDRFGPDRFASVAVLPLSWLVLVDLRPFRATCKNSAASGDQEMFARMANFRYTNDFSGRAPPTSRSGRQYHEKQHVHADRLVRFLAFKRHAGIFESLDLVTAPICIFADPTFRRALRQMSALLHIELPWPGWKSSNDFHGFLEVLPPGVTFHCLSQVRTVHVRGRRHAETLQLEHAPFEPEAVEPRRHTLKEPAR